MKMVIPFIFTKKIAPVPKVETRYVDENGNQLLPPKEGTQAQVGIEGYDYVSTNKDNNGNTIHVYKKKSSYTRCCN